MIRHLNISGKVSWCHCHFGLEWNAGKCARAHVVLTQNLIKIS